MIHFKICCIANIEEAQMAIEAGASAIGLVGPMPSGPGIISNKIIADVALQVKGKVETFLLTSENNVSKIIEHHQKVNTSCIQLVDRITKGHWSDLKKALPDVKLVQVIHVLGEESIQEALAAAEYVNYILLDSGNPNLAIKELGGTGRTHNWEISKSIVEKVGVPVFLAGGLNPYNVAKAIQQVHPYGVDICSGLRTDGKLDKKKLAEFVAAI